MFHSFMVQLRHDLGVGTIRDGGLIVVEMCRTLSPPRDAPTTEYAQRICRGKGLLVATYIAGTLGVRTPVVGASTEATETLGRIIANTCRAKLAGRSTLELHKQCAKKWESWLARH